jgi:small-conductance mechanosensitive channel
MMCPFLILIFTSEAGSTASFRVQVLLAARKNPRVLSVPAPVAVFKGFGDNSLYFELRVYINGIENW